MAEEEAAVAPKTLDSTSIHPKVGIPAVAGALVATMIGIAKAKWGLDLSGYETNLTIAAMALVGYLVPS